MNKHSSIKSSGSLLERASELYDFGAALRGGAAPAPVPPVVETEQPVVEQPKAEQPKAEQPKAE
ncbi:MAG TPA: exopolysaccharide biosynthesis protein, partial [Sphingorhabdus lacus]|nr:exopolysaccharide biosynthesis protein [Sphingorhabdus lacus]